MIAAVTGLWFVACLVLGARHEARVLHYEDAAGRHVHATAMLGEHTAAQSDIHASGAPSRDHDACDILTGIRQAARASAPVNLVLAACETVAIEPTVDLDLAITGAALYRLAPKTSPPLAA
ncbi:MAG TPA: hypothetical protein VGM88_08225 [Kofleriaceae bacterium]